jgi:DNA polymerase III delta subunit
MSAARKAREPGPLEQLEALQRELAAGQPLARGYLVRGEEGHFRELALRALCEAAARAGLELARHDAGDPDFRAGDLCNDLSSASMFAPARCVVVRRAQRLLQQEEGQQAGSAAAEAAIAFLRRKSEPGVLLLEAPGLRVDSLLAKALREAGGGVLSLRKLYASPPPWERGGDLRRTELVQWLLSRARARGIDLRPDDAVFIAAATGNELAALEAQLERVQHRGGASLREVVPWTAGSSPFEIADWLVAGDLPRALSGLEALFRAGFQGKEGRETNESALVAMLFGSLRGRLSAILAALEDPAAAPGKEAAEHLPARTPAGWRAFAREFWRLERLARTGAGVDVDRLFAFALRTRLRRSAPARSAR